MTFLRVALVVVSFVFGISVFHPALGAQEALCNGVVGSKEGQCAPDFTLKSLDGVSVRLSSLKGKLIFLNFWASWCEPCKIEIPALADLNDSLQRYPFMMVAVSINQEGAKEVEAFLKKTLGRAKIPFLVLLDPNSRISHQYGTFKVPETYIIDPFGKVRDKVEGIENWNSSLIRHYLQILSKP